MATGATFLSDKNTVILSGYSRTLQPFIFLIYDINNFNFELANKRKLLLNLPFHQIEGIVNVGNADFFITNEQFNNGFINVVQKIHKINLSAFLSPYFNSLLLNNEQLKPKKIKVFPNPANDFLNIELDDFYLNKTVYIYNTAAILVAQFNLAQYNKPLNITYLATGLYVLKIENQYIWFYKK